MTIGVEEEIRMRIVFPFSSHIELLEIELGLLILFVETKRRAVADLKTWQGEVVAHLDHELDDECFEARQDVAVLSLAKRRLLRIGQLGIKERREMHDL